MKKRILGGLAATAMFAAGLAVDTSTALADEGTETVAVETTRVETTPVETMPVETTRVETMPVETYAVEADVEIVAASAPDPAVGRAAMADDVARTQPPVNPVTYTGWTDGAFDCGETSVTQTRTEITTRYVWNEQDGYVLDPTTASRTDRDTQVRDLTAQERDGACAHPDAIVTYGDAKADDITCDSTAIVTRRTKSSTPFVWDADSRMYVETETVDTMDVTTRPLSSEELAGQAEKCSIAMAPSVVAVAQSPVPPAPTANVAAAGPPAPAAGELPATGTDSTGVMVLIALLATSLGGLALLATRRRNVAG